MQSGQIVNSNAHCLLALVERSGGVGRILPIARDSKNDLMRCLGGSFAADVVISSGGVSVGDFDFMRPNCPEPPVCFMRVVEEIGPRAW